MSYRRCVTSVVTILVFKVILMICLFHKEMDEVNKKTFARSFSLADEYSCMGLLLVTGGDSVWTDYSWVIIIWVQ